jgi:dihydroorotate dehydrogenase electron transfer subunit
MFQENARILWNKNVGPSYFKIGLTCHQGYLDAQPGQFVMVRLADRMFPLLRRPFSIHRLIVKKDGLKGIELLYKVVGQGTQALSKLAEGDHLDILGPLGKGFVFLNNYHRIFIAAGGIGIAPMVFLASRLHQKGVELSRCIVFLGGRSKNDLLCADELVSLGMAVQITTDDGSAGKRCLVTHPLEMATKADRPDIIYACGPLEMLKCVANIAEAHAVPCQVSIETVMACGMGACLGCAVETQDGAAKYLHACVDGPVFDVRKLKI